jgi:uncharacterized protein YcfJ
MPASDELEDSMHSNARWKCLAAAVALLGAGELLAQATLYEHDGFEGRSVRVTSEVADLGRFGFNDRASSLVIERGRWEVCEDARYSGRCVVLPRGNYDTMAAIGLNDRISSLREVPRHARNYDANGPYYAGNAEYQRRGNERVYMVPVTSARAVFGRPEQRCWIEQEPMAQGNAGNYNVPGAIAGAIVGGIIGHQIGGGRGQDIATAGGAVGGAAVGANIGRDNRQAAVARDVQHCAYAQRDRPEFWDVTYEFRGVEHRVQMTSPPGPSIAVNDNGEPRV